MALLVRPTSDARFVLDCAGDFLRGDPVRHNLILTLLRARAARPSPGRYWVVEEDEHVVGVVFQSPLDFVATVTPMPPGAVIAAVDAIVDAGVELPGVNGEVSTAARFAGHWTERTKSAARPEQGQRLYQVDEVVPARATNGGMRLAVDADRELLTEWFREFGREIGEPAEHPGGVVALRIAAGQIWVWEDALPVAMTGLSSPIAETVRVGPVYTPPDQRERGYAASLVAAASATVRAAGQRCILYTDLGNPTSNSVYRSIGYRAVAEAIRYRFDPRP